MLEWVWEREEGDLAFLFTVDARFTRVCPPARSAAAASFCGCETAPGHVSARRKEGRVQLETLFVPAIYSVSDVIRNARSSVHNASI